MPWKRRVPVSSASLLPLSGNPALWQGNETTNWLRVLDTAERSQIDQGICHQLHPIVSLLDAFKSEQQPLELVFPRKGPFDTHPQCMDGCIEEPLASALGGFAIAGILFDVG